jgi:hypothetical protein
MSLPLKKEKQTNISSKSKQGQERGKVGKEAGI